MDIILTSWLIRYGNVLGGGLWVGGYALLALVIIPMIARNTSEGLVKVAINVVRFLTYSGMGRIFFGILLIFRTRGFATIFRWGEWGLIITSCVVIAIALLGIGDGALRPALRHLAATGDAKSAQRYAWIGFLLTVLAIGLMTRALYART